MSNEIKPVAVFVSPIATRSGYGDASKDFGRALIRYNKYDLKFVSTRWGNCPMNQLSTPNDDDILSRMLTSPLTERPHLHIQCSIPPEFQPQGKFNIGRTAGIETNVVAGSWIDGINKMNLIIVPSLHAKQVFEATTYTKQEPNGQKIEGKCQVPIEILFEGADLNIYKKTSNIPKTISDTLNDIPEDFLFLFVGHWLQGELGQDRKDVGMLVKVFLEVFKNKKKKPALLLKTSGATFSVIDRTEIIKKIDAIKTMVSGDLPNIYLLHGDLSKEEINGLYNHPKVKVHASFTKGEGFCVLKGTKILTENGIKNIEDIISNEKVLTHDGTYQKVIEPLQREYTGNMIEIKCFNTHRDILFTPNHQIYTYNPINKEFSWKPSENIKENDYLVQPLNFINKLDIIDISKFINDDNIKIDGDYMDYIHSDKTCKRISRFIKMDSYFGKIIGYYLSEGCISDDGSSIFSINKNEEHTLAKDITACFAKVFGITDIIIKPHKTKNTISVICYSKIISKFLEGFCGNYAWGKIIPNEIMISNKECKRNVLSALFAGDAEIKNTTMALGVVNEDFVRKSRLLLLEFGIISSVENADKLRINKSPIKFKHTCHRIRINRRHDINKFIDILQSNHEFYNHLTKNYEPIPNKIKHKSFISKIDGGEYFITKVKSVNNTKIVSNETLYNLSVENNESYATENFMVHNCRPLLEASLSGKPVIASGWSGHIDFLDKELAVLLPGELRPVHPSSVNEWIIKEGSWFTVNYSVAAQKFEDVFNNYQKYIPNAEKLRIQNEQKFGLTSMDFRLASIFDKYVPKAERQMQFNLPSLKKFGETNSPFGSVGLPMTDVELPKLKRI